MSKLSQEKLKWFYDFQRRLKEEVDIDTTKKADMGRVRFIKADKVVTLKEEVPCEKGEDLFHPEATTKIVRRELPAQKVPVDELILEDGSTLSYNASSDYAFVKRNSDMSDFEATLNVENPMDVINAQETFDVQKNENGEYSINTNLSDEQLNFIYENAKYGKLYANSIDDTITQIGNSKSCFFTVADDNSCAKLTPAIESVEALGEEKLEHFYKNKDNAEFLKKPLTDAEATEEVILQETDLKKVSNAKALLTGAKTISRALQTCSMDIEAKGLSTTKADMEFWKRAHNEDYSNILGESDGRTFTHYLPYELGRVGVDFNLNEGKGFNNLFYYDKAKNRVFSIHDGPSSMSEKEERDVAFARIKEGLKDGTLYVAAKGDDGSTILKSVSGSFQNLGVSQDAAKCPVPEVKEPGFFKKILHSMNKNWFKDEFDEYNTYREKVAEFNNAKKLIEEHIKYPEPEQQELKPITEDEYKLKLAKGIIKARKAYSAEMYMAMKNYKPEDVIKEPDFEEFHASEKGQGYAKTVMSGKGYPMSLAGSAYIEFQTQKIQKQKAEEKYKSLNLQIQKTDEIEFKANNNEPQKSSVSVKIG